MSALEALAQDLRFAARTFRRAPGFALVTVLTLGLGIGATTAVFGVADAALLRPLPYAAAERLVALADQQNVETPLSFPELHDWRAAREAFTDVAAYVTTTLALSGDGGGEPEVLAGARASASLARVLGVAPVVGRTFRDDEDAPGAERVIMLGEGLWRRRFGADPGIVGRPLTLNGRQWTVVGVLPGGGRAALPSDVASGRQSDFWMPLRLDEKSAPAGLHFLSAVGRRRPGVDVARARGRLDAIVRGLRRDEPTRHGVVIAPLAERVIGDARRTLALLLAAVGLYAVVSQAVSQRGQEIGVRLALGADSGAVLRLVLRQGGALVALGVTAGAAAALGAARLLAGLLFGVAPADPATFVGVAAVLGAVAVAASAVPALRASRVDPVRALREG